MRAPRSQAGLFVSLFYFSAAISAYVDYRQHTGRGLADVLIVFLTFPFNFAARAVTGGSPRFEARGDEPALLIAATLICALLAYGLGAICGSFAQWLRVRFR